jgi:hypothetical protein
MPFTVRASEARWFYVFAPRAHEGSRAWLGTPGTLYNSTTLASPAPGNTIATFVYAT